jgi:opacity protein-like surface antigen
MMNKNLIASLIGVLTFISLQNANAADVYVEGQVGTTWMADVDTDKYSGTVDGITATNLMATLEYDAGLTMGAEIGFSKFGVKNMRLGLSAKKFKAKFNAMELNGSLTDGTTTVTGPVTAKRSDFGSIANSLDNKVQVYYLTGYYDFPTDNKLTPYVGVGVGLADIQNAIDKEFALGLSAGANYVVTEKIYLGMRLDYSRIAAGVTDKIGITYEAMQSVSALATIGFHF